MEGGCWDEMTPDVPQSFPGLLRFCAAQTGTTVPMPLQQQSDLLQVSQGAMEGGCCSEI